MCRQIIRMGYGRQLIAQLDSKTEGLLIYDTQTKSIDMQRGEMLKMQP